MVEIFKIIEGLDIGCG